MKFSFNTQSFEEKNHKNYSGNKSNKKVCEATRHTYSNSEINSIICM